MVWPSKPIYDGNSSSEGERSIPLQRVREYHFFHFSNNYSVIIQSRLAGTHLPLVKLSKRLYDDYADSIEIHFVNKKKIKVTSKNRETANLIAKNEALRKDFNVFIPSELCEVRGVVQIPADVDFTGEFIYENLITKHGIEYVCLPEHTKIVEVRRFTRGPREKRVT